jgi:hypothetical protein
MMPNSPQKNIQIIDDWGFFVKIDDDPIILTQIISKYNQRLIFISEEEESVFYSKIRKHTPTRNIIVMRNISSSHKNSENAPYLQEKEKEKEITPVLYTNDVLNQKIPQYIYCILTIIMGSGILLFLYIW